MTQLIVRAMMALRPGVSFAITGNDFNTLDWHGSPAQKPTLSEVNAKITELQNADTLEAARVASFTSDSERIDLLNRLKTATAAQIRTYVNNNVTDLASARTMLARMLVTIALDSRS